MHAARSRAFTLFAATLLVGALPLYAQSPNPLVMQWEAMGSASDLNQQGFAPYYLKIEFQIFDLQGKNPESGVLERWASPAHVSTVISSPSWNYPPPAGQTEAHMNRSAYLIDQLESAFQGRVSTPRVSGNEKTKEADKSFGPVKLHCLTLDGDNEPEPMICNDPENGAWRFEESGASTVLRDRIGTFRGKTVATSVSILFGPILAIKGKLISLHGLEPTDAHISAEEQTPAAVDAKEKGVRGGVVAGRTVSKTAPEYPAEARAQHIQGTVVLGGVIDKTGKVNSLVVIASPDPSLSRSAIAAVSNWRYMPYLLNGVATDVDTRIEVNFNLR